MLHVIVGGGCNNNCLFCMEEDRDNRVKNAGGQSGTDIRAMILAYSHDDEILFAGGEPTLNPQLPTYVRWAKERGFGIIGLISNSRRLAYRSFAETLVASGINRVTVSIHGHNAKLHDGQTRAPGSFDQTYAGLRNLCDLKGSYDLKVHTSTVLTTRTLPYLTEVHRFLAELPIDAIVFNTMMAKGRGAQRVATLMPRYRDVAAAFSELCAEIPSGDLGRLWLSDVPPCAARRVPAAVRGDLEQYEQFETIGSTGLPEVAATVGTNESIVLRGDEEYYLTDRRTKDAPLRIKGESCATCSVSKACPGVWQPYVEQFGIDEITPLIRSVR